MRSLLILIAVLVALAIVAEVFAATPGMMSDMGGMFGTAVTVTACGASSYVFNVTCNSAWIFL
jgi:hypothetical protein